MVPSWSGTIFLRFAGRDDKVVALRASADVQSLCRALQAMPERGLRLPLRASDCSCDEYILRTREIGSWLSEMPSMVGFGLMTGCDDEEQSWSDGELEA